MTPNEQAIYDALCDHAIPGQEVCSYELAALTALTPQEVSLILRNQKRRIKLNFMADDYWFSACEQRGFGHVHYRWNGPHEEQS